MGSAGDARRLGAVGVAVAPSTPFATAPRFIASAAALAASAFAMAVDTVGAAVAAAVRDARGDALVRGGSGGESTPLKRIVVRWWEGR